MTVLRMAFLRVTFLGMTYHQMTFPRMTVVELHFNNILFIMAILKIEICGQIQKENFNFETKYKNEKSMLETFKRSL